MARQERLNLEPEIQLAKRVIERSALEPRIDVRALVEQFATIKVQHLPGVDGVTVGLNRLGVRPTIYLEPATPPRRQRFTLAHELGHILIPWHKGTIFDELNVEENADPTFYRMEQEANRFAVELLMPELWCRQRIGECEHLADAHRAIVEIADVSPLAAAWRTINLGPPNWVFAALKDEQVFASGRTEGTTSRSFARDVSLYDILSAEHLRIELRHFGATSFVWASERDTVIVPARPVESWRSVLARMSVVLPVEDRFQAMQRLKAIVGGHAGRLGASRSADAIYARCLASVANRLDSSDPVCRLIGHEDFALYLAGRVHDLTR